MSWAGRRRATYAGSIFLIIIALLVAGYYVYLRQAPTCFDGKQNGLETGIDCGGACARVCVDDTSAARILWSRAFRVTDGIYNAVAYVENSNISAAPEVNYTFQIFDSSNSLIAEEKGTTFLPPNGIYPVFEGRIQTGGRVPARTFFTIDSIPQWVGVHQTRSPFVVEDEVLTGEDSNNPRLSAKITNTDLVEYNEVEAVATILDTDGTALQVSRTVIPRIPPRTSFDAIFTWPEPIAKTIRACAAPSDIVLLVDTSGSMNDDGGEPPQPITDAKNAARTFVTRLSERDAVSVATFATESTLVIPLAKQHGLVADVLSKVAILPEEEVGFTNIGDAISVARGELLSARRNPLARSVIILLTDGRATAPGDLEESEAHATSSAMRAKQNGIEIYAIGLGEKVEKRFLDEVASSDGHVYQAASSRDLDRIYRDISADVCEQGAAVIEIVPTTRDIFKGIGIDF